MSNRAVLTILASGLAASVLLAAGCSPKAPEPTVNESMTQVMSTQAQTVWDITSDAFNERGDGLVASKISPADWARLAQAGLQLEQRAQVLARAGRVVVASSGETIMGQDASGIRGKLGKDWNAASARQVQRRIDADRALFNQRAWKMADTGATIARAARHRDVRTLYAVSSTLDQVCDGCHEKFWGTDEPPPFPH